MFLEEAIVKEIESLQETDEVLWNVICDTSGQFHPNK
jgi:hypothetical protein